jgi:murein DD-endopeptidase MepM/ murein hydrolase activator NlpD
MRARWLVIGGLLLGACGPSATTREAQQQLRPRGTRLPPALPAPGGFGMHVLALGVDRDGELWAGTYGHGIFVLRAEDERPDTMPPAPRGWSRIQSRSGDDTSISWDFINSFTFPADGSVWYGTVGNGFGRSTDGGRTWQNWGFGQLGPAWQYVAHNGMRSRGDTVYIATADGLRITPDGGRSWRCVTGSDQIAGGATVRDGCTETFATLPTEYLLSLDVGPDGAIWVGHLKGLSVSTDGGRSWHDFSEADGLPASRVRAVAVTPDSMVWVANEEQIYVDSLHEGHFVPATVRLPGWNGLPGKPRMIVPTPGVSEPAIVLSFGLAAGDGSGNFRVYYIAAGDEYRPASDMWTMTWTGPPLWPVGGSAFGLARILAGEGETFDRGAVVLADPPVEPSHGWFDRPIADADGNPYIDATYRYGSTMGGNFQQHMGVEFNDPAGTPVRAIGDGVVAYAGPAEAGALTVAIRHDRGWQDQHVFSVYYHNSSLDVTVGQRVAAGQVIARVGNTGRATNDHLHLEVHVAPTADTAAIVNPDERFPPYTVNPELWLRPREGTGTVAGRVFDSAGRPVRGARIYGLVLPYPEETPYSFAETYGDRAHSDPAYREHFAVNDVPAGAYVLGVEVEGKRLWRRIRVEAGKLTFVEFRP